MKALMQTIGVMIVGYVVWGLFFVIVVEGGRMLDMPWLEKWFYCRVRTVLRVVRRVRFWMRRG